jgi:hypothetical protein
MLARPAVRQAASACRTNSDRGGSVVLADEDGGVVGVEDEAPLVGAFFADPEVVGDGAAVVGAADPLVVGAELEAGCLGRLLHGVEGGEEGRGVHAVAHRVVDVGGGGVGGGHRGTPPWRCVDW